ncbi:MAG: response regulator transcription factor [Chloroflexi bacterium]|nr:response regulator transcription factor [Chloroflexota bacterium]
MGVSAWHHKILVVDDEWDSPIVKAVRWRLEGEGWQTVAVEPEGRRTTGDEFEVAALYAIEVAHPDAVLLDVRFGEHRDDRFKGLGILKSIVDRYPGLPVLMFTQYAQGPERDTAVRGVLRWDAPVDFIDKLASPEEVVLRLRRLLGSVPDVIPLGDRISVDVGARVVHANVGKDRSVVEEIQGMKFEIFRELATTWYRSPGELVPFGRLQRYSEGDDPRASLRVRIREIKDALGRALGVHFGASDLIVNVRDQGYRLVPPKV